MTTYKLTDFKIQSTGADGGHYYISTELKYGGETRKLIVLFKSKSDEKLLKDKKEIKVKGNLIDEGQQQSLMLLDAEIIV
jgi:hypothetical protein